MVTSAEKNKQQNLAVLKHTWLHLRKSSLSLCTRNKLNWDVNKTWNLSFCLFLSWVAFLVQSDKEDFLGCGQVCFEAARFCWLFFSALVTLLWWHAWCQLKSEEDFLWTCVINWNIIFWHVYVWATLQTYCWALFRPFPYMINLLGSNVWQLIKLDTLLIKPLETILSGKKLFTSLSLIFFRRRDLFW